MSIVFRYSVMSSVLISARYGWHLLRALYVGLSLVFFLVGLTIKVGDLAGAALNMRLNLLTQAFSLGVLPAVGLGLAHVLAACGMHPALADGVLILVSRATPGGGIRSNRSNLRLKPTPTRLPSHCMPCHCLSSDRQRAATYLCPDDTAHDGEHVRHLDSKR